MAYLTPQRKAELQKLAEHATQGPWKWFISNSHDRLSSLPSGKDGDVISACRAVDGKSVVNVKKGDREFIEAANPEAILALLDENETFIEQTGRLIEQLNKDHLSQRLGCEIALKCRWRTVAGRLETRLDESEENLRLQEAISHELSEALKSVTAKLIIAEARLHI